MHSVIYASVVALVLGLLVLNQGKKTKSSLPLPPGPKPLPLIGNVHQAPKSHAWRTYLQWSKDYGPLVHVNMLGQSVVILSSSEVAHDILAKRGAAFSDRPRLFLATELALKGLNILLMNYNEQFRRHQKLQVSVLNPTPVSAYLPIQGLESDQLLYDLLQQDTGRVGSDVHGYFERAIASMIHTLLYGFRVYDNNDPVLTAAIKLNEEFSEFLKVGAHIVDMFPVLNNLPGFLAPWKEVAENHFNVKHSLRVGNFNRGLDSKGWNISKYLKKTVEKENIDMPSDELAFELGTMIDAALDGTTDTLHWFVVACITQNRDFITKAREELDAVVGRDRLPHPDDRPNLPYINAITEEMFRWRPVGPEGVPHFTNTESTYEGYTIPAKSVIVPNVWAITREEAIFGPDTDSFVPDRWLETDEKTGEQTIKTFPVAVFGYGRRACPGRHFARNAISMVIAKLLWSFDIEAGASESGELIPIDPNACTDGLVMRAHPFKASFTPRGPWVKDVIMKRGSTYEEDHTAMLDQIGSDLSKLI